MKLKELWTEEQAVSPVVGVVLMIAIAVVLAAVVGGVVLGLGQEPADSPEASLEYETYDADGLNGTDEVKALHTSGDPLPPSEISVRTDGSGTTSFPNSEVTAGESWQVADGTSSGDEIIVIWNDPNSDKSTIISQYTV